MTADMPRRTEKNGFSRETIKYLVTGTMTLNHIALIFLAPGSFFYELFYYLGFSTAITMCFFLVESCRYTGSLRKYGLRLLLFAVLSELPFCLAFTKEGILSYTHLNMLCTLFLCFLLCQVLDTVPGGAERAVAVFVLLVLCCFCDWQLMAPLYVVLFRQAGASRKKQARAFLIAAVCLLAWLTAENLQTMTLAAALPEACRGMIGPALSAFLILHCYRGGCASRGRRFSKWFFYLYYPAHLLLLGLIRIFSTPLP